MFETQSFKEALKVVVFAQAEASGMRVYSDAIVDYLQNLATKNEPILMETEFRKTAALRRSISDALISASVLVKEASSYAATDRRTILTMDDVRAAYNAKFCQVWPFCK